MAEDARPDEALAVGGDPGRRHVLRRTMLGGVTATAIAGSLTTALAQPAGAQSVVLTCSGNEFYNFGSVDGGGRRVDVVVPADCPVSYVIWGSGGVAGVRYQLQSGSVTGRGNGGDGGTGARWAGWIAAAPVRRILTLDVGGGATTSGNHAPMPGGASLAGRGGAGGAGAAVRSNSGLTYVYGGAGGAGGGGGGASAIRLSGELPGSETLLIVAGGGAGGGGASAYLRRTVSVLGIDILADAGGGNGSSGGSARSIDGPPPSGGVLSGANGGSTSGDNPGQGGTAAGPGAGGAGGGGGNGGGGTAWNGAGAGGGGGAGNYGNLVYEASGGGGGAGGGYHGGGGGEGGEADASAANRGGAGAGGGASYEIGSAATAPVPTSLLVQQPPFYTAPFSEIGRGSINRYNNTRSGFSGAILLKVGVAEIISDSAGAVAI